MRCLFLLIIFLFQINNLFANTQSDNFDTICYLEGYPEKTLKYNTNVHDSEYLKKIFPKQKNKRK